MSPSPDQAPLVLLLRSPDDEGEDRYVRAFRENGFRAVCRPVLRFAFQGDDDFSGDDVRRALRHPERYAGLIATSPRATQALQKTFQRAPEAAAAWRAKPAFAVGPKTAAGLRAGGLQPRGEESGSGAVLGSVIASGLKEKKIRMGERPLLFLCGNRRREALPEQLREQEIPFEECVAYQTHLRNGPWLKEKPAWGVFFSPSGVEAVQGAQEEGWVHVYKAAIGPTTAQALEKAGWSADAVAQHPSPEALVQAVSAANDQERRG